MVLRGGSFAGCLAPLLGHLALLGVIACEQKAYVSYVGDDRETCPGQCVPLGPVGWSTPLLLWTGPEQEAPACPAHAPVPAYDGHADLIAPHECAPCACEPPAGSCAIPTDLGAFNNATCCAPGDPACAPGSATTSFDAPAGWDGSCTTANAIPAGALCGNPACVGSILYPPVFMTESGCAPASPPVPQQLTPPSWGTLGRACRGELGEGCRDPGMACVPTAEPPPPGFAQCIWREGENECPAGFDYTVRHVLFGGVADDRSCTACECGAPEGGECTVYLSIYEDSGCLTPVDGTMASSATALCHPVIASDGFGSKSAEPPVYHPGVCAPTGADPVGSVQPVDPITYCCLP